MSLEWTKALAWLKPGPTLYIGVLVTAGVLLSLPDAALRWLGLFEVTQEYRGWVGGAVLLSGGLLLADTLRWVAMGQGSPVTDWRQTRSLRRRLKDLSEPEKEVLRTYLAEGTTTRYYEVADGVVNGLVAKKILYRSSNIGAHFTTFPFNLQPWAWRELRTDPTLLAPDSWAAQGGEGRESR